MAIYCYSLKFKSYGIHTPFFNMARCVYFTVTATLVNERLLLESSSLEILPQECPHFDELWLESKYDITR